MKKIDKILDMFDELFETQIQQEEAVFIVANSFYTSKDEKINRDTLFRYIKSQIDMELFHQALEKKDMSVINPERYPRIKEKTSSFVPKKIEKKEINKEYDFSPSDFINEINSLKEKLDILTKIYSSEKNILDISKKMFTISENNIKRATFRIEENILREFEEFCTEHKEYNKTLIINFMMKEFLEKYRK